MMCTVSLRFVTTLLPGLCSDVPQSVAMRCVFYSSVIAGSRLQLRSATRLGELRPSGPRRISGRRELPNTRAPGPFWPGTREPESGFAIDDHDASARVAHTRLHIRSLPDNGPFPNHFCLFSCLSAPLVLHTRASLLNLSRSSLLLLPCRHRCETKKRCLTFLHVLIF
ncbi:hypothetical protein FKP32DRAFT_815204 [Trametes sanguinea]|nr:hypothetical protein FKP32DRAFT_815204 [Trametes sanguinea]